MHALIDADRIAYAFGGFTDDNGQPLAWPLVAERVDTNIQNILQGCGGTSYTLYLTADDKSNFRFRIATIRPYKGHRSSEKSFWYEQIRRYLIDTYAAKVVHGMEADDAIGIAACWPIHDSAEPTPVICSVDKDLDNVPGYHYNELKPDRGVYRINEVEGLRNFYAQLLTGDSTDNIPGLYFVGPSNSWVKKVREMSSELDMYCFVVSKYESYFGSHWRKFFEENAQLLWIKRELIGEMIEEYEVLRRFGPLEQERYNLEAASKIESVNN
jgi:hypothetical protein